MSEVQLIVSGEDVDNNNIMFLTPNHLSSVRFCGKNIFDSALIKNCKVEQFNTTTLSGIYSSLKPGAKAEIIISQPITIMQEHDAKQIEANAKLVGFEETYITDTIYKEEKTDKQFPTVMVTLIKQEKKGNEEGEGIRITIKKETYSRRSKK